MPGKTPKDTEPGAAPETVIITERQFPIVIETKKTKKKKYSKGARSFQELEAGLTKSARKIAKAVREGLDKYSDERDESARDKRDAALRDILRNQSKALRTALPMAAEAPSDLLDSIADMKVVRDLLDTDKRTTTRMTTMMISPAPMRRDWPQTPRKSL